TPFELIDQRTNPDGLSEGTLNSRLYTFATLYTPNSRQHIFLTKTLRLLADFSDE
ncbi:Hypothetical predicted protein, partial [Pelobates cultripes]